MTKAKAAKAGLQTEFDFGVPEQLSSDGFLSDLEGMTARVVGEVLKGDPRSRYEVAGDVGRLLDDEVSKFMLDAYASPAREGHAISFARFLALVAATGRYDLLRPLLRRIGCELVVGEDVHKLEAAHLRAVKRQADKRIKQLERVIEPMTSGRRAP